MNKWTESLICFSKQMILNVTWSFRFIVQTDVFEQVSKTNAMCHKKAEQLQ